MIDALWDAVFDSIKLVPFLFLTYLLMEYLEHKTSEKTNRMIQKSGKLGPVMGGLLGVVPQCGFSAAASGFYSGGVITMGTLIAIFLSTSDEMIPIMISEQIPIITVVKILLCKSLIGMIFGLLIDFVCRIKGKHNELQIEELCDHEHCHCEEGHFVKSALSHTLQIFGFILIFTILLNEIMFFAGHALSDALSSIPVISVILSGLVGLIPNCAASVAITEMYLEGVISFGSTMTGLLSGTGVGLLVLFRMNKSKKDSIKIMGITLAIGIMVGLLMDLTGFAL